jgi:hypothetical protein
MYSRVEWSDFFIRISTTAGSQTKNIGPKRAYIKYQDIWKTFEPAAGVLKMAIFSQKTLFFCNPYLGSFKKPLDRRCCNKKPSTLFVLTKKYFWLLENRCTGSPERWKRARSPKNAIAEILIVQICYVKAFKLTFLGENIRILTLTIISDHDPV